MHWVHRHVARSGLAVRLVGLNTTLLAAGDDDQGKLRVGMKQIGLAFEDVQENELVLALGHHPLGGGWLADQATIEPWLKRHAHALLTGHVHVADAEESRSGAGSSFLRVVAGSAHGDRMPPGIPAGHGYSLGAVMRDEQGGVRIWITPRKWSEKNASFRPDVDNVPEGQAYSEHQLTRQLSLAKVVASAPQPAPKPSTRVAVTIAPDEPLRAFISVARADDAAREELQSHLALLRRSKKVVFKSSQDVPAGVDAPEWLAARLDEAHLVFLLISKAYIASDFYYEEQLLRAVERYERGEVALIPILLSPYRFSDEPFARLKFLPLRTVEEARKYPENDRNMIPANHSSNVDQYPGGRDKACEEIVKEVRDTVERLRAGVGSSTWK
jgi:hypothetical protein